MNDRYKFRGKWVDNGGWVYGCFLKRWTGIGHKYYINDGLFNHEVVPETVGQYIGLKDKNGVEIYEGDIVRHGYSNNNGEFYENGVVVFVVNDGAFEIANSHSSYLKRLTQRMIVERNIEVIGSIRTNPELLEVQNESE